jgi:hypothetical protein
LIELVETVYLIIRIKADKFIGNTGKAPPFGLPEEPGSTAEMPQHVIVKLVVLVDHLAPIA